MNPWFDDLTRILGSNLSRREAVRLMLGGLAGSYLSLLWPGRANAASEATACSPTPNEHLCATGCYCPRGTFCCTKSGPCCSEGHECCPSSLVRLSFSCCRPESSIRHFVDLGEACCGPLDPKGAFVCCDRNTHCCCELENRPVRACGFKPVIQLVGLIPFPVPQLLIRVTDPSGNRFGALEIKATKKINAEVLIPPPSLDVSVLVVAIKLNPAKPAYVTIQACLPCGREKCCAEGDPGIAQMQIPEGEIRVQETFTGIPIAESFVTIRNGHPGFRKVLVRVNGERARTLSIGPKEIRTIDVGDRMEETADNVVTVIGQGRPGASALVILSDATGVAKSARQAPSIEWEPGSWQPGLDLHWGGSPGAEKPIQAPSIGNG